MKNTKKYDVIALGEILIDFTEVGTSENGMRLFEQNPGGAPANLLSAVSRLGGKTAFIGKIGNDMHGSFLLDTLRRHGIDTGSVVETADAFTTLAFVSLNDQGERSFSFARNPGADTTLNTDDLDLSMIENSHIFHVGSLSLTDEPARSATLAALSHAKNSGVTVSYDPNYRAPLWKSKAQAVSEMRSLISYADLIKLSDEEIPLLTDCENENDASLELLNQGVSCVLITLGSKGAFVRLKDGCFYTEGFPVKAVDTTGAGDSFFGAFLYCLSQSGKKPSELTLEEAKAFARFANATAALCVGKRGAINAMPSLSEVNHLLNK